MKKGFKKLIVFLLSLFICLSLIIPVISVKAGDNSVKLSIGQVYSIKSNEGVVSDISIDNPSLFGMTVDNRLVATGLVSPKVIILPDPYFLLIVANTSSKLSFCLAK